MKICQIPQIYVIHSITIGSVFVHTSILICELIKVKRMQIRGVRLHVSIGYLDLNRENCNLKLISYLMKII